MKILIYKLNKSKVIKTTVSDDKYKIWRPGFFSFRHKRLPKKYIFWWFFHYIGVFKNKQLKIYFYYDYSKLAHFFCLVPKYYRWPFMASNDLQITYVVTEEGYQGKGIAFNFISFVLSHLPQDRDIWYVTDSENVASQNLALKLGFEFVGYGYHDNLFFGIIKVLKLLK